MTQGPIATLYLRELRAALRERSLVAYSLLLPLLLYPVVLWLGLTAMSFVAGQTDRQVSRVVTVEEQPMPAALEAMLLGDEHVEVVARGMELPAAHDQLTSEQIDLVARFGAPVGDAARLPGNLVVELYYDGATDRSSSAWRRVDEHVARYREDRLAEEARAHQVTEAALSPFEVERNNVATGREMGGFLLGSVVPMTMLLMIALGTMYPAIDTIAGERERSTWETTLTLGVSRGSLVVAKYLYVATLGTFAGLLNLAGMAVSLGALFRHLAKQEKALAAIEVTLPPSSIPVIVLGTVLLALLFAALLMIAAAFARTYKEGQSVAGPVFMLALLPTLAMGLPDEAIGLGLAAVPGVNVMLLFKQTLSGGLPLGFAAMTLLSSLVAVVVCLRIASVLLDNEDLLAGTFEGSPGAFMRRLLRRRRA